MRRIPLLVGLALSAGVLVLVPESPTRGDDAAAGDPSLVVGAAECKSCHEAAYLAWEASPHHGTEDLLWSDDADAIAERYDPGVMPDDEGSACRGCHIAVEADGDVTGVSCESCHGGAKGWLDRHGLVLAHGVKVQPHEEDPSDARARIARAVEAGMIPSTRRHRASFVLVAENCFSCHTVGNERLVNEAGHPAGSPFDLVAWSQGIVRHNFHRLPGDASRSAPEAGRSNVPASREDLRIFHVAGKGLDLEFGLRLLAGAKGPGAYATALVERVRKAGADLRAIQAAAPAPEVSRALAAIEGLELVPGNPALAGAAGRVRAAILEFVEGNDGTGLEAIDRLVPTEVRGEARGG